MLREHRSTNGITASSLLRRGCRRGKPDGGSAANAAHVAAIVESADSRSCPHCHGQFPSPRSSTILFQPYLRSFQALRENHVGRILITSDSLPRGNPHAKCPYIKDRGSPTFFANATDTHKSHVVPRDLRRLIHKKSVGQARTIRN